MLIRKIITKGKKQSANLPPKNAGILT